MDWELSSAAHAALLAEAAAAHPRECCGLLLGQGRFLAAARPARNLADDPRSGFVIDPAALVAAQRAARGGGPQLLGYYHSHPNGRPDPSPRDAAFASGDGRVWAIVAGGKVRLFRDAGVFKPLFYTCRSA